MQKVSAVAGLMWLVNNSHRDKFGESDFYIRRNSLVMAPSSSSCFLFALDDGVMSSHLEN